MSTQPTAPTPAHTAQPFISKPAHHWTRTFFAGLFGAIAVNLILASILVIWLNHTLLDTNTYVRTVAPLVTKPDIQAYVASNVTTALIKSSSVDEVSKTLLNPVLRANETPAQQREAVDTIVSDSVAKILGAPKFQKLWTDTNRSAHDQLLSQLRAESGPLTLDLSPLVQGAFNELKTTKLAAVSDQLTLPEDAGKLNLKGGAVDKAHHYYRMVQTGILIIIGVTILSVILCVTLSVEHARTIRRILVGTAISTLLIALLTQAPSMVNFTGGSELERRAAVALASALFHDLQLALIAIGLACSLAAGASKLHSMFKSVR